MNKLLLVLALAALSGCSTPGEPARIQKKSGVPLILDTDPALGLLKDGRPRDVDDGLAIIEAINSERLDLLGITIVFGNSDMPDGYRIAGELVKLKNVNVPVYRGAESPTDNHITPAVKFMASELRKRRLTIAAIGPLTNVASLIRHFPKEARNIDQIVVVMGRSPDQHFYLGTYGPVRDFNYVKDTKSAKLVIESGIPMVMTGFELSSQALITHVDLKKIKKKGSASSKYLFEKSQQWLEFWHKNFPHENGFHPWDSAAIAYLNDPGSLKCEKRGYRFRMVKDEARKVGTAKRKRPGQQPWYELGVDFKTKKHTYCPTFGSGGKEGFLRNIVDGIY